MSALRVVVVAIVCAVASSSWAAPAKKPKKPKPPPTPVVAVLPFGGVVDEGVRARLEASVRAGIVGYGFAVEEPKKTQALIRDVIALGFGCDDNSIDCMVRVGALGGAELVLAGVLSPEEGATRLELIAVDVAAVKERSRVRVRVPRDDPESERAQVDSALLGTFKPEAWRGQLRVQVSLRGASIVVDGVPRGFAPLSQPLALTPGPHQLFVGLEGYRAHKASVDVVYGEEAVADVVLVPGETEAAPVFQTATATPAPAPAPTPEPQRGPQRIVLYDVETTGVAPRTGRVVGALLTAELRKREGLSVLDSSEVRALVGDGGSTNQDMRRCSAAECFAEVAEALGADGVVVAQLTQVEDTVLFGLRRIDQNKQEVLASFVERVPANDESALLPLVGKSVGATFGDFALRKGQVAGVDARAASVLHPPPVSPTVTTALAASGVGFFAVAAGFGVAAGVALTGRELALADFGRAGDDADENATLAGWTQGVTVGVWGAGIASVVAAGLGGTAYALAGQTDWDNNAARFGSSE